MSEAVHEEQEVPVEEGEQFLVFSLADELFCLEISIVQEIKELQQINKVFMAPEFLAGAVNIHGQVTAVIDLCRFFDIVPDRKNNMERLIVLSEKGFSLAFLVDSVGEIIRLPEEEANQGNPMEGEDFKSRYIKRVLAANGILVNVLDMERMLGDLENYFKEDRLEH